MTYSEAAIAVLEHAGRPLTTAEVFTAALERGLIMPPGKTPERSMSAALYQRVKWDTRLVKLEKPGRGRAMRGSVRWALRDSGRA